VGRLLESAGVLDAAADVRQLDINALFAVRSCIKDSGGYEASCR